MKMVVNGNMSFAQVSSADFHAYSCLLLPNAPLVSKDTVRADVLRAAQEEKAKLQGLLTSLTSKISITTDCWTSGNSIPFCAVTAHWVDSDWKQRDMLIAFRELRGSHTGENLCAMLSSVLVDWGINTKLMGLTCDNATNNNRMVRLLHQNNSTTWDLGLHIRYMCLSFRCRLACPICHCFRYCVRF